jgi:hypothetical protein
MYRERVRANHDEPNLGGDKFPQNVSKIVDQRSRRLASSASERRRIGMSLR